MTDGELNGTLETGGGEDTDAEAARINDLHLDLSTGFMELRQCGFATKVDKAEKLCGTIVRAVQLMLEQSGAVDQASIEIKLAAQDL